VSLAAAAASELCAALAALAQSELSLVESGAYEELEAVHARRVELLAAIVPPAGPALSPPDRVLLQSAARTQMLAAEAMRQRRDELARELGRSGHARRAAAGYRASAAV
jgi:hypothetical protein